MKSAKLSLRVHWPLSEKPAVKFVFDHSARKYRNMISGPYHPALHIPTLLYFKPVWLRLDSDTMQKTPRPSWIEQMENQIILKFLLVRKKKTCHRWLFIPGKGLQATVKACH